MGAATRILILAWGLVAAGLLAQSRPATPSPTTRYDYGLVSLTESRSYLDLDDHAARNQRRVLDDHDAECMISNGTLRFFDDPLKEEVTLADWPFPQLTWTQLRTSAGRRAWVRRLRRRDKLTLEFLVEHGRLRKGLPPRGVRYPVVLAAEQGLSPSERIQREGGRGLRIEAHVPDDVTRVDISVMAEETGLPVPLGTLENGSFIDESVRDKTRRTYRLRAFYADGRRAADRYVVGARHVSGIVSGRVNMIPRGSSPWGLDFMSGFEVRERPDLVLVRCSRGLKAQFRDWTGGSCAEAPSPDHVDPWVPLADSDQTSIPPETDFDVPLRGGGVARCRWHAVQGRRIELSYRANFCGPQVLPRGQLVCDEDGEIVRVRLEGPADLVIQEAVAEELTARIGTRRSLEETEDPRLWTMARPPEGVCLEIRAEVVGTHGWRETPLVTRLDRRKPGVRRGTFRLRPQDGGFAFAPAAARAEGAADLTLTRLTSAGSSYLGLTGGQALRSGLFDLVRALKDETLDPILQRPDAPPLEAIRMLAPRVEKHFVRRASIDGRLGSKQVLVLRTRDGGWAVVRVDRAIRKKRSKSPQELVFEYLYNPREPVFGPFVEPLGVNEALRFVEE